jgi:hypothetical protein
MKFSAFNSFLAFFRKKAGMSGAGSTRFLAFSLFLVAFLLCIGAIFGVTWRHQASAQTQQTVDIIDESSVSLTPSITQATLEVAGVKLMTQSLRITLADGTKSIGQLLRTQTTTPIPNQALASFHFLVDASNNTLIFPNVEGYQPPGFQWAILPGQDKRLDIPEIPLLAPQALDYYYVRTSGTCNFILVIEFYPPPL